MVLFESYYHLAPEHLSEDTNRMNLTLKTPTKWLHPKNVSLLVNINIEAYSVDPDQTAPLEASGLDLHCKSKGLQIFQQTTKAYDFL